jgi:hypothetical protein
VAELSERLVLALLEEPWTMVLQWHWTWSPI